MGLTGRTSWTASTSRTTENIAYNEQIASGRASSLYQGRYWFVNSGHGWLPDGQGEWAVRIEMCRFQLKTDASGCASLSFTCSDTRNANSSGGTIYWKIMSSAGSDTSGMTQCSWNGSSKTWSGTLNARILPNTTFYVLFYSQAYMGNNGQQLVGTLTFSSSGTYGSPGEITANNTTFDSPITMSYGSSTSGGTYTVQVQVGTSSVVTLQTQASATSKSWTPLLSTYGSSYPNQSSVSCVITVYTYFAGTLSGTKSKTVTISFTAAQAGPSTSNAFSIAPYNTGAVSGLTGYIQGYSKIRASFNSANVTRQYGATIAKWSVKFGSAAAVDVAAGTATKDSGAISTATTVVCTVTDSRGFTASETYTTTITQYENPALTATVKRADGSGQEDDAGTYLRVDLAGWYSDIAGQNTQVSVVRKKLASASSYDADVTVTGGTTTLSGTRKLYSAANFLVSGLADAVYNVQVEITDALGNKATVDVVVESQHWAIHFRNKGSGAALGRSAEYDGVLDLGTWDIYLRDSGGNIVSLKTVLGI